MNYTKNQLYELEGLREYINTHYYGEGSSADYDFDKLFNMFSAITIFSIEDIFVSAQNFKQFILDNIDLIHSNNNLTKERILSLLTHKCEKLKKKILTYCGLTQQQFAEVITKLTGKNSKILDVGAGEIPYSSILLAENSPVATMDKNFQLSNKTIKNLNVTPVEEYFTTGTKISDYDIVVGQRPCSAIANMVSECVKQNKPYFIELCNCHIPPSRTPGKPATWETVLPEIDAYVRFYGDYAYNIDATPEQVEKIIEEHRFFNLRERYLTQKLPLYDRLDISEAKVVKSNNWVVDNTPNSTPEM